MIAQLRPGVLVIEENGRLIGECNFRSEGEGIAEIGIKICETDCQNRDIGKNALSMMIRWLFDNGIIKIALDTNLNNKRAQHVYELLGFCKVQTNIDSCTDQLDRLQSSVDYELVESEFMDFTAIN